MGKEKRKKKDPISIVISILTFLCVLIFFASIFFYWKSYPQFIDVHDIFYRDPYKVTETIDKKWQQTFFYSIILMMIVSVSTLMLKSQRNSRKSDHYPVTVVIIFILSIIMFFYNLPQ